MSESEELNKKHLDGVGNSFYGEMFQLAQCLEQRVKELEEQVTEEANQTMNAVEFGQAMVKKYSDVCQELAKIKNVSACGSVESFLACDDETKRNYFAMMVLDSSRVKELEVANAELIVRNSELKKLIAELEALIKESKEQKPVAWIWKFKDEDADVWRVSIGEACPTWREECETMELFAAPVMKEKQ